MIPTRKRDTNTMTTTTQTNPGQPVWIHEDCWDPKGHCACCGKEVNNPTWAIELVSGGVLGDPNAKPGQPGFVDPDNDDGYMGCWSVGNTCRKKFATAFKWGSRN
jgi:hypothetical protein